MWVNAFVLILGGEKIDSGCGDQRSRNPEARAAAAQILRDIK
jgi:hypothetical protein